MGDLVEFPLEEVPILAVANALEEWTDSYMEKIDGAAEAQNAYLRKYHEEFRRLVHGPEKVAATLVPKLCENAAVDELCASNKAGADEKRGRAKVDEVKARLMAFQSHARVVAGQT